MGEEKLSGLGYNVPINITGDEMKVTKSETNTSVTDALVIKHTAFKSLADMCDTHPNYRPSVCVGSANPEPAEYPAERRMIADAYDSMMEAKGDDRRAYRYGAGK